MVSLKQLCRGYVPCTFEYRNGTADGLPSYADWIEVFRKSIPTFKAHALTDEEVPQELRQAAAEAFELTFSSALDALLADPDSPAPGHPQSAPLNCYSLCLLREQCLHAAGFRDVFAGVKAAENEAALAVLPALLREMDELQGDLPAQLELALRGVFAGNIFDLGAAASAQLHAQGGASAAAFAATRARLLPRPWAVDDLDSLMAAVRGQQQPGQGQAKEQPGQPQQQQQGQQEGGAVQAPQQAGEQTEQQQQAKAGDGSGACIGAGRGLRWRKAALFVDNAGPDVVLGVLPLARVLLEAGAQVLLLANRGPSINDITAGELAALLQRAAPLDPRLLGPAAAAGALRVVCSGSDMPVIDLTQLSQEAVDATADCDLIVLEGMGRAIETNLRAAFSCDSLKLGMIKHPEVAAHFSGRLYDCVCKFDRGVL